MRRFIRNGVRTVEEEELWNKIQIRYRVEEELKSDLRELRNKCSCSLFFVVEWKSDQIRVLHLYILYLASS